MATCFKQYPLLEISTVPSGASSDILSHETEVSLKSECSSLLTKMPLHRENHNMIEQPHENPTESKKKKFRSCASLCPP
jgi:hypothetical protein